jgi:hypothetical protein
MPVNQYERNKARVPGLAAVFEGKPVTLALSFHFQGRSLQDFAV